MTPSPTNAPSATRTSIHTSTPTPASVAGAQGSLLILPPELLFTAQVGRKVSVIAFATDVRPVAVQFEGLSINESRFQIENNACRGTLEPFRTCALTVTFSPKEIGQYDGQLTFSYGGTGSPQKIRL